MISFNVDLGQIIIGSLICIVGYFLKREINTFANRLDNHDKSIIKLVGDVQRLIGAWDGIRREKG
jgi:hypothetical protein